MSETQEQEPEITKEVIQRFMEMQAAEGKTPIEAIEALLKFVGAETVPEFKAQNV